MTAERLARARPIAFGRPGLPRRGAGVSRFGDHQSSGPSALWKPPIGPSAPSARGDGEGACGLECPHAPF